MIRVLAVVGTLAVAGTPALHGPAATVVRALAERLAGLERTAARRATLFESPARRMTAMVDRGRVPATRVTATAVRGGHPGRPAAVALALPERSSTDVRTSGATRPSDRVVTWRAGVPRRAGVARRPDRSLTGSGARSCAAQAAAQDRLGADPRVGLEARR